MVSQGPKRSTQATVSFDLPPPMPRLSDSFDPLSDILEGLFDFQMAFEADVGADKTGYLTSI